MFRLAICVALIFTCFACQADAQCSGGSCAVRSRSVTRAKFFPIFRNRTKSVTVTR
jgi:hypothetical protein